MKKLARSKFTASFKKFFIKLYIALDEMQRKKAAEIIWRYRYLIPERDELSDEQKKPSLPEESVHTPRQVWREIPWA